MSDNVRQALDYLSHASRYAQEASARLNSVRGTTDSDILNEAVHRSNQDVERAKREIDNAIMYLQGES